jgi:hypothetical protein
MKKILVSLSALSLLFSAGMCVAGEYLLPEDKPALSITFPDDWTVEGDEDNPNSLSAISADEAIEIDVWAVDKKDLKEDVESTLLVMATEVSTLIDEYITDFQAKEPQAAKINEVDVIDISGKGKDKESGEEVNVSVTLIAPDNENLFVLMYWGSDEAEKQHADQLTAIAKSIKKP